jgi:endonuclease/exonuclease/phosphatase family metal-dependent hydrolase
MRVICLNVWGGRAFAALERFLREQAAVTDVFCFQEVYATTSGLATYDGAAVDLLDRLVGLLPDFEAAFAPILVDALAPSRPVDFALAEGLATLTRRTRAVLDRGVVPLQREVYRTDRGVLELARCFQYTTLDVAGRPLRVVNVHGVAEPGDKLDTAERLGQSRAVLEFLRGWEGETIVCGDFNLLPETASIGAFERGLRNLIREFGITNTRSRLTPQFGTPEAQYFADYAFASAGLAVWACSAPYMEVSDHLPVIVDFD